MEVYERFKKMINGCQVEEEELQDCCLEMNYYLSRLEHNCGELRRCLSLMMKELDCGEEILEIPEMKKSEETELPVAYYMAIRDRFNEETANKFYYDVNSGKVSLTYVRHYFSKLGLDL